MKHKITITTKGFTSFDTMQTTIICRKPSKIAKCIDAGAKHIPHWDRKRIDVNIAPGYACDKDYARLATPEEAALCKANNNQPTPLDWKPKSSDKTPQWIKDLKKGDIVECIKDYGSWAITGEQYTIIRDYEPDFPIYYRSGYCCTNPEDFQYWKLVSKASEQKPKSSNDSRYPVKQYMVYDGTNGDEVFKWLKANGSTRTDKSFMYKYYWIDLTASFQFLMTDYLSEIPKGFTEYKPNQPQTTKQYTSTKKWALDNGYELRQEGCSKCDLRRPNGESCSLFYIGYQMGCDSGPSGSFHKKKSHLVEAIQSLNMAGIHLGTSGEQLPINLVNVFREPQSFDDKPDILIKPSNKRTLIQVQV